VSSYTTICLLYLGRCLDKELKRLLAIRGSKIGMIGTSILVVYNLLLHGLNLLIPRLGLALVFIIVSLGYALIALSLEIISSTLRGIERVRAYALAMVITLTISLSLHVAALYVASINITYAVLLMFFYVVTFYVVNGLVLARIFRTISLRYELKDFKIAYYTMVVGYVFLPLIGLVSGQLGLFLWLSHIVAAMSFLFSTFGFLTIKRALS